MKTIIDKNTGEALFCSAIEVELQNNQIAIDDNNELYQGYVAYLQNDGILYDTDYLTELDLDLQRKELVPNSVTKRQLKQALVLN